MYDTVTVISLYSYCVTHCADRYLYLPVTYTRLM